MKKSFLVIFSFTLIVLISSCRNNAGSNPTTDVLDQEAIEMEIEDPQIEMASKISDEEASQMSTKGPEEEANEGDELIIEENTTEKGNVEEASSEE